MTEPSTRETSLEIVALKEESYSKYPVYLAYGKDKILSSDDSVYSEETGCCIVELFKRCIGCDNERTH